MADLQSYSLSMHTFTVSHSHQTILPARILQGWAIRLVEDIPDAACRTGEWLAHCTTTDCEFSAEADWVFSEESHARKISDFLRGRHELKTEVVRIGKACL